MIDILLAVSVLAVFIFGFYISKRIDLAIEENQNRIGSEHQIREPNFIVINGEKPLIEIDKDINEFREKHDNVCIVLCDHSENEKIGDILSAAGEKIEYR